MHDFRIGTEKSAITKNDRNLSRSARTMAVQTAWFPVRDATKKWSDEAGSGRGPDTVLRAGNEAVGSPGARLGSPGRGLAPNSGVASPPSGNNTTTAGEINAKVKYLFIF